MEREDYENIDRPYNNSLIRSQGGTGIDNGNVETQPVKSDGAMADVWIKNFIRSENWKPKSIGFYLDGLTGYAEFVNVYVSGEIDNGLLRIVGNDIYLYDESYLSAGTVTGNTASIIFSKERNNEESFVIQNRVSIYSDDDSVLEIFHPDNDSSTSGQFIFIGSDGDLSSTTNKNVNLVSILANKVSGNPYSNRNGRIQIGVFSDGVIGTSSVPNISVFDSRAYGSSLSGVSANMVGYGTHSIVGIGYSSDGTSQNGALYLYFATAISGVVPSTANYTGTHFLPDVDSAFDIGSSDLKIRDIYANNIYADNVGGNSMEVLTSSGTWTVPDGVTFVRIKAVGGGAGGGSVNNSGGTNGEVAQSGGGGAYCEEVIDLTGVTSVSYSIGAGGPGGAAGASNPGTNGGDTTFGAYLTAGGGNASGTGGTATGGQLNVDGGDAGTSWKPATVGSSTNVHALSGIGGSSIFGPGAPGAFASSGTSVNGVDASSYGSGGSGAASGSGGDNGAGGSGAQGVIILYY